MSWQIWTAFGKFLQRALRLQHPIDPCHRHLHGHLRQPGRREDGFHLLATSVRLGCKSSIHSRDALALLLT